MENDITRLEKSNYSHVANNGIFVSSSSNGSGTASNRSGSATGIEPFPTRVKLCLNKVQGWGRVKEQKNDPRLSHDENSGVFYCLSTTQSLFKRYGVSSLKSKIILNKRKRKMNLAEKNMEDRNWDLHFEQIMDLVIEEGLDCSGGNRELDWWLNEYPTLQSAEAELLDRHQKTKALKREDFPSMACYLSEVGRLDREVMMLEMTIDELYTDWMPTGAKHSDFRIGTIFRSGSGRWLCTDVGQRTICAIRYTPRRPDKMNGPPYIMTESVWDEYDIEGVEILKK